MERINVIFRLRPKMRLKNSQLKVEEVLRKYNIPFKYNTTNTDMYGTREMYYFIEVAQIHRYMEYRERIDNELIMTFHNSYIPRIYKER